MLVIENDVGRETETKNVANEDKSQFLTKKVEIKHSIKDEFPQIIT